MRTAAGILLIIFGVNLLAVEIVLLHGNLSPLFPVSILHIVVAPVIVAGGILCIRRRYWGVCLASALLAVYIVVWWLRTEFWLLSLESVMPIFGILSLVFVCITRKEWGESIHTKVGY
jgi:hypothetical protein